MSCGLINVMMMNRFLPLLPLLLASHLSRPVQPLPSRAVAVAGAAEMDTAAAEAGPRDGTVLHRSKRGWMWNQFYLMEEYTANEYQYVGKLQSNMDRLDGTVRYILTGEGAGTVFQIDEHTGDLHAVKKLDREEKANYTLQVQAVDTRTNRPLEPETEFIIKIHDINDNAPQFAKATYAASVPEMTAIGTPVLQVTATDADDASYGNSAKLVYSILQGQPYFSVEPDTGWIKIALSNMDREVREKYYVVIQAKDMGGQMGGLSGTTDVNITLTDVNDSPPRFSSSSYHLSTLESADIGSVIGRIKAKDGDQGQNAEMEYSITDGDAKDFFNIISDKTTQEGIITLKKKLDYESQRVYTIKVEVNNTKLDYRYLSLGPFKDTATVKITAQDVDEPPVFSMSPYVLEVREDMARGNTIGKVTAWDPDTPHHPVRYSIDHHTNREKLFYIDPIDGSITTLQPLDRELSKWHNISVLATEINNPQQLSRVPVLIKVLDVNDNAPEFAMYYETFVCENVKAGQIIQTISATDTDEPLVGHKFVFSLNTNNPNFTILDNEDNTARILTRRSSFNRHEVSAYYLPVVISDNGFPIQTSTSTLTIRVCGCDSGGNLRSCSVEALLLSAGLSTSALVAILLCIILLLMIVALFSALKRQRRKEPLIISKEDVRDNVVSYNDEGGGEEDTQAFDMGALRHPEVMESNKQRRDIIPEILFPYHRPSPTPECTDARDFINCRLQENDNDPAAPPYDSLATYAYEGNGSTAESLSSLGSSLTEGDHDFDYLSSWGPQFKKLADMYIAKDKA